MPPKAFANPISFDMQKIQLETLFADLPKLPDADVFLRPRVGPDEVKDVSLEPITLRCLLFPDLWNCHGNIFCTFLC